MKVWWTIYLCLQISIYPSMLWLEEWETGNLTVGVIDRWEGEKAVLVLEKRGLELAIDKKEIPANAVDGDWFLLKVKEEPLILQALEQLTNERRARSRELLNKLQKKHLSEQCPNSSCIGSLLNKNRPIR